MHVSHAEKHARQRAVKQFNDEILNRQEEITETICAEQNHRNCVWIPVSLLRVNWVLQGGLRITPNSEKYQDLWVKISEIKPLTS